MIVCSGSRDDVLFTPIPLTPYAIRLPNATSHDLLFNIFLFFFSDFEGLVQTIKTLIIDEASRSHFNREEFGRVATCSTGGEDLSPSLPPSLPYATMSHAYFIRCVCMLAVALGLVYNYIDEEANLCRVNSCLDHI